MSIIKFSCWRMKKKSVLVLNVDYKIHKIEVVEISNCIENSTLLVTSQPCCFIIASCYNCYNIYSYSSVIVRFFYFLDW